MVVTLMTLLPRFSSPEVKQVILIVFHSIYSSIHLRKGCLDHDRIVVDKFVAENTNFKG